MPWMSLPTLIPTYHPPFLSPLPHHLRRVCRSGCGLMCWDYVSPLGLHASRNYACIAPTPHQLGTFIQDRMFTGPIHHLPGWAVLGLVPLLVRA